MPTLRIGLTADGCCRSLPIAVDAEFKHGEQHGDKRQDAEKDKEDHGRNATD
jgi:hypothetical protein